jgi:hypothetical protein
MEKFRTTKENDGNAIPMITDNVAWSAFATQCGSRANKIVKGDN